MKILLHYWFSGICNSVNQREKEGWRRQTSCLSNQDFSSFPCDNLTGSYLWCIYILLCSLMQLNVALCESANKCGCWSVTRFRKHECALSKATANVGARELRFWQQLCVKPLSSKSYSFITPALQRIIWVTIIVINLGLYLLCYVFSVNLAGVPLAKNCFDPCTTWKNRCH